VKVAIVQMNPVLGNVEANLERVCAMVRRAEAEVVVLPELALSGYFFTTRTELDAVALERSSPILDAIARIAQQQSKAIIVGFPEKDGQRRYNTAVLFDPSGQRYYYRKTHLFYKERLVFDEGDTGFEVVSVAPFDLRIGMMICYDWRFPEAARTLALAGAELIACPSNLVTHIWRMAMPVRALENKVYLAVANRIGSETCGDETLHFNGRSAIYSYNGTVLAELPADTEGIAVAPIEPERTRSKSFNPYNDLFADRRPWAYRIGNSSS
jgi:predicted amidohydrolase